MPDIDLVTGLTGKMALRGSAHRSGRMRVYTTPRMPSQHVPVPPTVSATGTWHGDYRGRRSRLNGTATTCASDCGPRAKCASSSGSTGSCAVWRNGGGSMRNCAGTAWCCKRLDRRMIVLGRIYAVVGGKWRAAAAQCQRCCERRRSQRLTKHGRRRKPKRGGWSRRQRNESR